MATGVSMMQQPKVGRNRGNAGKGRPKGVPNKSTAAIKDMILNALDKAGGVDYLVRQADENPGPFMTLVGKVLPLQVQGDKDNPLQAAIEVRFVKSLRD